MTRRRFFAASLGICATATSADGLITPKVEAIVVELRCQPQSSEQWMKWLTANADEIRLIALAKPNSWTSAVDLNKSDSSIS